MRARSDGEECDLLLQVITSSMIITGFWRCENEALSMEGWKSMCLDRLMMFSLPHPCLRAIPVIAHLCVTWEFCGGITTVLLALSGGKESYIFVI